MSLLVYGALTLIFVKQSEVNLKIAKLAESGSNSIKYIGRGNLDCLWRILFIFFAWKPRTESSLFINEISVDG